MTSVHMDTSPKLVMVPLADYRPCAWAYKPEHATCSCGWESKIPVHHTHRSWQRHEKATR